MSNSTSAAGIESPDAAGAFAEKIGGIINSGAISVMLSVGHRTGLFDTMAGQPPRSSMEIASAANLSERYVREWLAAMVTGGIVHYDPNAKSYHLPDSHAACLTRNAPLGNAAVYAQFIPMAGAVQDIITDRFATGGGTKYDNYPCFHSIMAEDTAQTVVASLFETILPLVDGVQERLTAGIDVLDAGCGTGSALIAMAGQYPSSRFTGYDFSTSAINQAQSAAASAGVTNVRFTLRDLTGFEEPDQYDFITSFDAVHDQKDPQALLTGIHGALRKGGMYLMQDIGGSAHLENNIEFPFAAFLYTVSCLHCMPISLGQDGAGLGTMWGWETAERMLEEAGFAQIDRHVLPHDPMNVWFVSQKS